MTRKLTLLMMALATMMAWQSFAFNNPEVRELDIDVDSDYDGTITSANTSADDTDEVSKGGIVFVGAWTPITIKQTLTTTQPGDQNTVRLSWKTNHIELAETSGGAAIAPEGFMDTAKTTAYKDYPGLRTTKTLWVHGISTSHTARAEAIRLELQHYDEAYDPNSHDEIAITVCKVEVVSVATDENNGEPIVNAGEAQMQEVIDLDAQEKLCTYAPDPGDTRGSPNRTTSSDGGGQLVTIEVNGSTAELVMTHPTKDLVGSWALSKVSGTEGFDRYILVGDPKRIITADLYHPSQQTTEMDLKIELKDENFTGSTSIYNLSYSVFAPESGGSTYWNYRMDSGSGIGYPDKSERSLHMVRINAGGGDLNFNGDFRVRFTDDYQTHDLTMVKRSDNQYYSQIIVPVLHIDSGKPTGLEASFPALKIIQFDTPQQTISTWNVEVVDNALLQSYAKLDGKIDKAMLISFLNTDEEYSRSQIPTDAGTPAVQKLGLGVTPTWCPEVDQLKNSLKSHRMWIHSGHGNRDLGILAIKKIGANKYKPVIFSANDVPAGLGYRLVFMNTCESTDQKKELNPQTLQWVLVSPQPTNHMVYDIGVTLGAANYIGWDTEALRELSVKVPRLLVSQLNGVGSSFPGKNIKDAVAGVQQVVRQGGYNNFLHIGALRAVTHDNQTFDTKKSE